MRGMIDPEGLEMILKSEMAGSNYYEPGNYLVSLDMTWEGYLQAIRDFCETGEVSRDIRVIFHENGHWLQNFATPYGTCLETLRDHAQVLLFNLLKRIVEICGRKVKLPVIDLFWSRPEIRKDPVCVELFEAWLNNCEVRTFLLDPFQTYIQWRHRVDSSSGIAGYRLPASSYVREMDRMVARRYLSLGDFSYVSSPNFLYDEKKSQNVMEWELNLCELKNATGISSRSMFESFSTALEWSLCPTRFAVSAAIPAGLTDYLLPLEMIRARLGACSKNQWLCSSIAVFDILFAAPALPQCSELRAEEFRLFDFDIVSRFFAACTILSQIGPIRSGESYEEYEKTICDALGWPTPMDVAGKVAESFTPMPDETVDSVFLAFQKNRVRGFWPFFDREAFLAGQTSEMISVPVIRVADMVCIDHRYNNEVNFIGKMILRQFSLQAFQKEFVRIRLPYKMEARSVEMYREMAEKMIEEMGIQGKIELYL